MKEFPGLHECFEFHVRQSSQTVAVICGDKRLSYTQLNVLADKVAFHLRSLKIKPETPVGICLDRSLEMAVGILGILKSGGAYVPLDPQYPADRLSTIQREARLPIILTAQHLKQHWSSLEDIQVLDIQDLIQASV